MIITNDSVNAEHDYRGVKLGAEFRTAQRKGRWAGRILGSVAIASLAMVACGQQEGADDSTTSKASPAFVDDAPAWEPNGGLLEELLGRSTPDAEVAGESVKRIFHDQAPTWAPNSAALRKIIDQHERDAGPVFADEAPSWEPDEVLLESIVGGQEESFTHTVQFAGPF